MPDAPTLTRRMMLAALGSAGVGASAIAGGLVTGWWNRTAAEGLGALSPDEHALVQAMAEAWMPAGTGDFLPLSGAQAGCGAFVDGVVAHMAPDQERLFKLLLQVLDEATLPTHLARFTSLDLPTRTAVVVGWTEHPSFYVRQGVGAVMALIALGYTNHPEVSPVFAQWFGCGFGA